MIISRFPFVDSRMLTYPLGGDPLAVIQGTRLRARLR